MKENTEKVLSNNRSAYHDYSVLEKFEAGIILTGDEVKSVKNGNLNLKDSFREVYPEKIQYSWWSYRTRARERNVGWRIDYFVTSKDLEDKLAGADIHTQILGSDHCPVELTLK